MENENEISDPKEIPNKFNDYFADIGKSIASEIPKDPMYTYPIRVYQLIYLN